jgi:ketosteroid isomerase-like protein
MEREAVGQDGEQYAWTRILVCEHRDGRFVSMCLFDLEGEDAAFEFAEERLRATTSRLAVTNRAGHLVEALASAMRAADIDGAAECYADPFVYDDHRRLSGDPISNAAGMRGAAERLLEQYTQFETRPLAVRGERLYLFRNRLINDAGYETTYLFLYEIGEDGLIHYEGRFDEDDFEGAYRELERRYYAGEGAGFAEAGALSTEWMIALNTGDFDRLFVELTDPGMRIENRSRSPFPDRTASEFRASLEELDAMVSSARTWLSAIHWLSPTWAVIRVEREAVGRDGDTYAWTWLQVSETRDTRLALTCLFELDDEEAAFAYADERMQASASRLPVTNRASEVDHAFARAFGARDLDGVMGYVSDLFVFDDRRQLSGQPIGDVRAAMARILAQYSIFEMRSLAVRGERLHLFWSRWSDDAGNETAHLHVHEVGDECRIVYEGRFDEDDFEGAYRELESRYYAWEGAAFAEQGALGTEWVIALNQGDFDRVFNELTGPDMRVLNRSLSVFGDPTAAELRASFEELYSMVDSARAWSSALCWLSPMWVVARFEREAVGRDGEKYAWARLQVIEIRDGRLAELCRFEVEDEDAAFAYAEARIRSAASRLTVRNRSSETVQAVSRAMQAHDVEGVVASYADELMYDDRRRLTGDPIHGAAELRAATERILEQYNQFEWRTVAVRGEYLHLTFSRWSNDAGFETTYLHVVEIDDGGRIVYSGRFDDDDFESAYGELERRYYAGEGAAVAETGAVATDWIIAINRDDFDRAFGELSTPDLRVENRSRAPFPDRSATDLRATFEALSARVASARTWNSVMLWLSSTWVVQRLEREAVGPDGEKYEWTRLHVCGFQRGRLATVCQFELDDEEQAFAYAEERVQATASRLAVTNRASEMWEAVGRAMQAHDVDAAVECYSEPLVYDDRRRLGGNPLTDIRTATERVLEQYSEFQGRTLAVRGHRLCLGWSRWANEAGLETAYLVLNEMRDDGRFVYEGRFDEDNFEGAYLELERRYFAGEGAAFAEGGTLGTEWVTAVNQGDLDRLFGELTSPEMRVENRSRSLFGDLSAAELRAAFEQLHAMVASVRSWNSAECWLDSMCGVVRHEREAVGLDGERYTWTQLFVFEFADGRCVGLCEFELDDEAAAIAYAEERIGSVEA